MIATLSIVGLLMLGQAAPSPPPAAVRGVLVDAGTNAPLASAHVTLTDLARSMQTGVDGRFAFDAVPPGRHTLTVSLIGYIFVKRDVEIAAGTTIDLTIPLTEGTGTYQETIRVSPAPAPLDVGVGAQHDLGSAALQDLRSVAADDPMRAVQALPGVATGDDFQAQFSVRGSQFRHVGIVLDGTATPLLLHTVRSTNENASIAMINTDVLERASLRAGAHPRRDGDWLGATLAFDVREGSRDRAQVRGAVSATSASMVAEGPLTPNRRGSWLASIRKSYIDWLVRKLYPDTNATLGFADLQSKLTFDLTQRQRLELTAIAGESGFRDDLTSLANGIHTADSKTALASVLWRYTRDAVLLSQRVSVVHATFADLGRIDQELGRGRGRSGMWRTDVTWFTSPSWTIDAGAKVESQRQSITQRNFGLVAGLPRERAALVSTHDTTISSVWGQLSRRTAAGGVSAGMRVTADTLSARTVQSPWVTAERRLGVVALRAGAGISHQFPELELQRALPNRVPERAAMADAGIEGRLPHQMTWQLGGFWSRERDVLRRFGEMRLENGTRVSESTFPMFGSTLDGRVRGVDVVFARRAASGFTGWASYTYAHARHTDQVTRETFDADFDQRHTVNVFVQQRLSYRSTVSAKFRYGSNFPLTGYYEDVNGERTLSTERNRLRLPAYARLDLRANRTFTYDTRRLTLFVEIVNVTGHENLTQAPGTVIGNTVRVADLTRKLLPFLPSAGILVEF